MRQRLLRLLPGLAVSLTFTAWFVGRAHWTEVGHALAGVELGWVGLSAAVLFTEFLVRALRWKVLLRPIAPQARLSRLFVATVIGMSLNVVLPFRAGDFARPWLGARETGTPMLPLVTIAVIERVFDLVGLLGVFLLAVALLPADAESDIIPVLRGGGAVFGLCGVVGLGSFVWMAADDSRARGLYEWGLRFAPAPIARKLRTLFHGLAEGLASVRDRTALLQAVGLSLLHWLNGTISIWLLFHAFALALPFGAAAFTSVVLALTVLFPQAPGFFGVFHFGVEQALRLWGMDAAPAQAYAIVFWAVSFVPVTTVGFVLSAREGLDRRMFTGALQPPEPARTAREG